MKLAVATLVLDGEPWIEKHLPTFANTYLRWNWIVVHGSCQNQGSTRWCRTQEPRFSGDGTAEYLASIASDDPRITLIESADWKSKDDMINAAVERIKEPCVLMQIDADEIYTPKNLERVVEEFMSDDSLGAIQMRCRYFVGPDLICIGDNCWSNKSD